MKFAVSYNIAYYGVDPDRIMAYARHVEECGFESLYLPEHIVLYPGATVGSVEIPSALPVADPLECLSFVAFAAQGVTRIVVGATATEPEQQRDELSAFAERFALLGHLSG